ncbi:hypothetical protein Tco_0341227 [Tanacetum coccineum]
MVNRCPALPTLPFITSPVTASPLEEGGDHTDSVTGPSLRTVGPSVRFVVLSDSFHHSATNSKGPEGDSFIRFTVPVMTEATAGCTIANYRRSGSGFTAGSIRAEEVTNAGLEEIYVPGWTVTKGFELNDGRSCANMIDHFTPPAFFKTVRRNEHDNYLLIAMCPPPQYSLEHEVRKYSLAEYNILGEKEMKSPLLREKDSLLGAKDKEIEELRVHFEAEDCFAEIDADFTMCCMRFQEFHPTDLTTTLQTEDLCDMDIPLLQNYLNKKEPALGMIGVLWCQACPNAGYLPRKGEKMGKKFVEVSSLLKDVFVSLDHPLSAEALIEPPVVVPATNALSTVVIVPHSGPSVSVEDYENPDLVDVVPKNVTLGPESEENIDASTGGDPAFSRLENEARDVVL